MDRTTDTATSTKRASDDAAFYGDSGVTAKPALVMDSALPGAFLRAMAGCASQDPTRTNLAVLYFHGVHVVVTDGHTLTRAAVLPSEGRATRNYLIAAEVISRACKIAGARGIVEMWVDRTPRDGAARGEFRCWSRPPAKHARHAVRGELLGVVAWTVIKGGAFPPYEKVIPAFDASPALVDDRGKATTSSEPSARIVGHGVNARYLARMADVVDGIDTSPDSCPVVLRSVNGPLDPIAYTAMVRVPPGLGISDGRRMITFVIMPMRVTASDYEPREDAGPKVTANPCLSKAERKRLGL